MKEIISKIKKMSFGEVNFRLRQRGRIEKERMFLRTAKNGTKSSTLLPKQIQITELESKNIPLNEFNFFGLNENHSTLQTKYLDLFSEDFKRSAINADRLLHHSFHFLGYDFVLSNPVDWTRNPLTGQNYPQLHYSQIKVKNSEKYGDIKYLWELNRHQFFIELGKAYFLTGDEKYVQKVKEFIDSWIDANPYKCSVNWTSALESAVRIFSWIWTFYFTEQSTIWTSDFKRKFLKNLILEGTYIEENLSYYFSPYNHLIGELAALTFLGTVFPISKKLIQWRDKYWQELEDQIDKQFHRDGFTVEQASYYHHFTLGFYLMTSILRKHNNLPVSPHVWERIAKALEISMYMTRPDGHILMIGDIDNARSIYFSQPDDMWNLRSFLALGAVLFGRGDMKYVASEPCEEILWLLGNEGLEKFEQMKAEKPDSNSRAFPESGYFIMRDGWDNNSNYCCFDCGEIADGLYKDDTPSAAHGHADILSFELTIDGQPIVIDPGFYTYFGDLQWHRYFRSTRGHNSIEVNGHGQSVHENRISWSGVSSPQLQHWITTPEFDFVSGRISKFSALNDDIFHRRSILFNRSKYFLVMDEIAGNRIYENNFKVENFLHFTPGEVKQESAKFFKDGKKVLWISASHNAEMNLEYGGEEPDQGWTAKGYGYRQRAPLLKGIIDASMPVFFGMLFPVAGYGEELNEFSTQQIENGIIEYQFSTLTGKESVYLNTTSKVIQLPDTNVQTDAFFSIAQRENGYLKKIRVFQVRNLLIDNTRVIKDVQSTTNIIFNNSGEYEVELLD